MADESQSNTRSIDYPFLREVLRADPNWGRDERLVVEDERRPDVVADWRRRGPYAT